MRGVAFGQNRGARGSFERENPWKLIENEDETCAILRGGGGGEVGRKGAPSSFARNSNLLSSNSIKRNVAGKS